MEGGIENADHGDAGHQLLAGPDADDVGRVVQGSQLAAGFDLLDGLFGQQGGLGEFLAAVHDAVADRADLGQRLDHADLGIRQLG